MLNQLPEHTKKIISAIEKRLGFELYDYQKEMIITGRFPEAVYPRRSGRTTAYMLFLMLSDGPSIDFSERDVVDMLSDRFGDYNYARWFKREFERLYEEMKEAGLEQHLRKVIFRRNDDWKKANPKLRGHRSKIIIFDDLSDYQEKEKQNENK